MHILFYAEDGAAAKAKVLDARAAGKKMRAAHCIACHDAEPVDGIEFMPDVTAYERKRLRALFGVTEGVPLPPPPPPPPVDALANLPKDWRNGKTKELTAIATSIDGRAPENREQAIQLIDAALAARAAA